MRRFQYLIGVLAVLALVGAACGDDPTGEFGLIAEDTLTVCTDAPYFPMEYEEDGVYKGFDMDLMRAIAADLELGMVVVNSGWDPIVTGLGMQAGDCDVGAASMTILPERAEAVAFSDPYFGGDQSLLVRKGEGNASLADLGGKRIGVQSQTTGEKYANDNNPGGTVVSYDNPGDLLLALTAGEVDGVLQDIVANAGEALQNNGVEVVATFVTNEVYGFAFEKTGREKLIAAVDESLAKLRDDGTYDTIFAAYFG